MKLTGASGTTARFAVIGVLVLAMYIPLAMVDGVTAERQRYFERTMDDVASAWGGEQAVSGPFLVVPEVVQRPGADGEAPQTFVTRRVILPSRLDLQVDVRHQMRSRALYEVPVYTAVLRVQGSFPPLNQSSGIPPGARLDPADARVVLGISHTRAISRASDLTLGGDSLRFESGTGAAWPGSGIQAAAAGYDGSQTQAFSFELELKGSRALGLTPVGAASAIGMTSSWPHPSFAGQYLPAEQTVSAEGFAASWQIHELARDLPASWRISDQTVTPEQMLASVRLFQPVTGYRVVDRAIKYGVLFIALTFLTFLCFELTLGLRFHPVQYGVVGLGLVLFYLALLSLSEHLPFGAAYLVATGLLTALIAGYVRGMTASSGLTLWTAVVVAALYGVLYVLLKLETYALLVGTGVLFLGLGALMFSTRSLTEAAPPGDVSDQV